MSRRKPFAPNAAMDSFFAELKGMLPEDGRIMLCQFRGDPNAEMRGKWRAYVLNDTEMVDEGANVYLCVSAMRKNARGEFRRRKENFAGGLLLMIDDLGEGKGAKFPMSTIDAAPPTALIETSPDNYQAVYFFDKLVTNQRAFDALIAAFIKQEFLGKDTGMAGVNRVFRPPAGVNGKPKYGGWRVRLAEWHPERRYSVKELAEAFGLTLAIRGPQHNRLPPEGREEAARSFPPVRKFFAEAGMIKARRPDLGDWFDVRCPWTDEHTGGVDNGAALRMPAEENAFYGGFRCHHGACLGRGLAEVKDWINDSEAELLDMRNAAAGDFYDYTLPT